MIVSSGLIIVLQFSIIGYISIFHHISCKRPRRHYARVTLREMFEIARYEFRVAKHGDVVENTVALMREVFVWV